MTNPEMEEKLREAACFGDIEGVKELIARSTPLLGFLSSQILWVNFVDAKILCPMFTFLNLKSQGREHKLPTRHQWLDSIALGRQEKPPEHRQPSLQPRRGQERHHQQGGGRRSADKWRSHKGFISWFRFLRKISIYCFKCLQWTNWLQPLQ